jgi:hypothetical protein
MVWSLQKFRSYLLGAKIVLLTDHKALTFLRSCKLVNSRLTRWILAIQDYDLEIEFCPGKDNIVADTLSRLGNTVNIYQGKEKNKLILYPLARDPKPEFIKGMKDLKTEQAKDPTLIAIKEQLQKEESHKYSIIGDVIYKKTNDQWKIYLPQNLVKLIINECHELYGHAGAKKVYKILIEDFFFPRLAKLIRKETATCDSCQRNKVTNQTCYAEMRNLTPSKPSEILSIDFYGPLPTGKSGVKYILVTIDAFSKFVNYIL